MDGEADIIVAEINRISLGRFREGGAAIFEIEKINHHRDIDGAIVRRPFMRKRLRVWVKL